MKIFNPLGIDIFELVLFLVEYLPYVCTALAILFFAIPSKHAPYLKKSTLLFSVLAIPVMVVSVFLCSWEDAISEKGFMSVIQTPSIRVQLEKYIVDPSSTEPLHDIIESDKYSSTMGVYEIKYLLKDLFRHTLFHSDDHNTDNIDEGYNKGNDWFSHMLGETMMYTSGLYPNGYSPEQERLEQAQNNKIDMVADAIQLKPQHNVLDIGCGWGHLARRFSTVHEANVTGITLSEQQHKFSQDYAKTHPNMHIMLQDAMKLQDRVDDGQLLPKFDRVVSLEMAEHVGIVRYQEFLKMVYGLLEDDGVFYLQVAGLRRAWTYEDLVWGLFMGEHIFPGADASCPLGWITTQVERSGFEIQRVHNMGSHYSLTLNDWLTNWRSNEKYLVDKYGAVAYRRWEVFLAWSVKIARQGSSALFMLVLTKQPLGPDKIDGIEQLRRIATQNYLVPTK